MGRFDTTKATINANIKKNGNQEITGSILNSVMTEMVDATDAQLTELENRKPIVINGNVTNAADEEDLTSDENELLKLKDRNNLNGMGYVIIRKNKTFAEQLGQANTIYEIRYKFDLNGGTVNIPKGCVLKFTGGIVSNGTIVGNNTAISESSGATIFGESITLDGSWIVDGDVMPEWWGAESILQGGSYVGGDTVSLPSEFNELKDSSVAINNALTFSMKSSSRVALQKRYYKITSTVNIPNNATLHIPRGTFIVPVMSGVGTTIATVNKTDSTQTTNTLGEEPMFLYENQYVVTDAMSIAVSMSYAKTNITGGGTIFLGKSKFTIGILIKGIGYQYTDMSFTPKIDVSVIGAPKNQTGSPSSTDIIGDSAPTEDVGNDGDYYYNKTNHGVYVKKSGAWSLKIGGSTSAPSLFNTSMRLEAQNNTRIINPYIDLWDMYGFRGIEIITGGNGWINESIIRGTVSEKHGSCFSIFAAGGGVSIHDWSKVIIQCKQQDYETTRESRILFASKCNIVNMARTWDLSWPALPYRCHVIFEMCPKATNVDLSSVDAGAVKRIVDYADNIYPSNPSKSKQEYVIPKTLRNILSGGRNLASVYYNGTKYLTSFTSANSWHTGVITHLEELEAMDTSTLPSENISVPSKYMFDDDSTTYYRAIDTANGKYNYVLPVLTDNPNNILKEAYKQAWLEIDVRPSGTAANDKLFAAVSGYGCDTYIKRIKKIALGSTWGENRTYKIIFPLKTGGTRVHPKLYIYLTEEVENFTLDIFGVKLWVDSDYYLWDNDLLAGNDKLIPNSARKGRLYYNTTDDSMEYNSGDAESPKWRKLQEKPLVEVHDSSVTSLAITPNVLHQWDVMDSLKITLNNPSDSTIINEYMFEFKSGDTATSLSLPSSVKFPNEYTIEANKTYQVSIVNNIGLIIGV